MERRWKDIPRKSAAAGSKNKQVQGDRHKDFANQQGVMEAQKNESCPAALPLYPPWTSAQRASQARMNLLPASSIVIPARNEIFDGENCHSPQMKYLSSLGEGESSEKFLGMESQIVVQDHASETPKSNDEVSNACQSPKVTIAVPSYSSTRPQRTTTERLRRARFTEMLKSLQELLPQSKEASREAVLDGTIDYIKYLQLQIKTLSQSRLDGDATDNHFINLEGFGHYLVHQQMLNEPLEDMVGRLMEANMPLFKQLLESKGLAMMPMTLAGGLL